MKITLFLICILTCYISNGFQGLENISRTWEVTEFDIAAYKDKGHFKLRFVLTLSNQYFFMP